MDKSGKKHFAAAVAAAVVVVAVVAAASLPDSHETTNFVQFFDWKLVSCIPKNLNI